VISSISLNAAASTRHEVRFSQTAKIVVWQGETLIGEGADVSLLSEQNLAPEPLFGAGQLDPVGATEPALTPRSVFKIASNSGFIIETSDEGSARDLSVRLISEGENAQARLIPLERGSSIVFEQAAKTAIRTGAPASQAISVEVSWLDYPPAGLRVRATGP